MNGLAHLTTSFRRKYDISKFIRRIDASRNIGRDYQQQFDDYFAGKYHSRATAIATQIYIDMVPAEFRKSNVAILRKNNSKAEAGLATQLKTVTAQGAVDYIETQVTNLASAKAVLKIMRGC